MQTTGHRVLITGGGTGIGLALARCFATAGNSLVLVGRRREPLEAARSELGEARVEIHTGDVGDADVVDELPRRFPDVSVLVNNAGIQRPWSIRDVPAEGFRRLVEDEVRVNLVAPVLLTRAFLPGLEQQAEARGEAAVVNVTSALALSPKRSTPVYNATKAGLHSFTRVLRWQLEDTAVRVFEVLPPTVATAMTEGRSDPMISTERLTTAFWRGWRRNREQMLIGPAKWLALLTRVAPWLADRILRTR